MIVCEWHDSSFRYIYIFLFLEEETAVFYFISLPIMLSQFSYICVIYIICNTIFLNKNLCVKVCFKSNKNIFIIFLKINLRYASIPLMLNNFNHSLKYSKEDFGAIRYPAAIFVESLQVGRVKSPLDLSRRISGPNSPHGRRRTASSVILVCPELFNFRLIRGRNRFFPRPSAVLTRAGQLQISFGSSGSPAMHICCVCIRKIGECHG